MAQTPAAGVSTYVAYGFETTYGTGVVCSRPFGHGAKISNNMRNNMERIYSLGARNASTAVAKKFEGSASVEFVLSHASFFRGVLGSVADSAGPSPYTHTYSEANTIPSITIETGSELGSNDEISTFLGGKINTCTLTTAVGEVVRCRLEVPYKTMTLATTPLGTAPTISEDPLTFAEATLSIGGTINYVQSIEITFNNTLELLWGLGSRLASATIEKMREYNVRMTVAFSNVTQLMTKFLGASGAPTDPTTPAAQATLVLTLSNGLSTTYLRSVVITLANLYLDVDTLPKDVNEIVKEDVEGFCLSGTSIIWTNETASDDDLP